MPEPSRLAPDAPWLLLDREADQLRLCWPEAWMAGGATIRVVDAAADGAPLLTVTGRAQAVLSPPPASYTRLLLRLSGGPLDGQTRLVAERRVPFATLFNVRDIGGYPSADGRRVRYGLLFRAAALDPQTVDDAARLAALNVRQVWDLRSPREAARQPDRLPDGWLYTHTPLQNPIGRWRQLLALLRHRRRLDKLLLRGYTEVAVDHNAPIFGALLRRLAAEDALPLLVHCSAGKDRTGIAVALLLRLLGVAEALVVDDYALSNQDYEAIAGSLAPELAQLRRLGVSQAAVRPLLTADPAIMRATLAHIERRYGSLRAYLTGPAAVPAADLARLRERFLET